MTCDISNRLDVSRETSEALTTYRDLVLKWNKRINLIGIGTLSDVARRHIRDCEVILDYLPAEPKRYVDIGTGAGLPGVIVAIHRPDLQITLVEADGRKASFLREVRRKLNLDIEITAGRIEDIPPLTADVVSARALAAMSDLLHLADRHVTPSGSLLLMKGRKWEAEVADARKSWHFDLEVRHANPDTGATLLEVRDISRR